MSRDGISPIYDAYWRDWESRRERPQLCNLCRKRPVTIIDLATGPNRFCSDAKCSECAPKNVRRGYTRFFVVATEPVAAVLRSAP